MWMMSGIGTVVCLRLLDARREPSAREVGGGEQRKEQKKSCGFRVVLREDELLSQLAITIDISCICKNMRKYPTWKQEFFGLKLALKCFWPDIGLRNK